MVDVWAPNNGVGGSMMRPDRSFRFTNGKLIVETDVAAGIQEYGGFAWPEVTVSLASAPDGFNYGPTPARSTGDDLYAYGRFGGYDTIGIRLAGNEPIQAYYDATERGFQCGRVWELSWFQDGSGQCEAAKDATIFGGGDWVRHNAVRDCQGVDPDTNCRDRFRWELTRDQITLYANGTKYMEHTAVPGKHLVPDSILNGEVYVYFSDSVYRMDEPPAGGSRVIRFHWDRVAVNPSSGLTASTDHHRRRALRLTASAAVRRRPGHGSGRKPCERKELGSALVRSAHRFVRHRDSSSRRVPCRRYRTAARRDYRPIELGHRAWRVRCRFTLTGGSVRHSVRLRHSHPKALTNCSVIAVSLMTWRQRRRSTSMRWRGSGLRWLTTHGVGSWSR